MVDEGDAASASERAYQVIREAILDGTHQPGEMLGEASLAASLGMSRTPVRVALARLQDEGWIVVYPKRGALVQGLSERTIVELADARFVLEATAVDRAPDVLRQRLADVLERSIGAQREAFASEDVRRFIDLTLQFHRGFVEAGGNGVLLELYDRLADRHRFVLFAAGDTLLARCAEIISEHERLTEHLRVGDVTAFASTLRGHIAEVSSSVADTFPAAVLAPALLLRE
ncbi:GntR family transcriptional regulator [Promicromonospora kroppenstedtii]|uniref:GntR family transcriptional regulator n=1 Tax=Promicromonospora kroppenstedtii TaxID=440482 RepID=A0ABW7XNV9_9MICO